MFDEYNEEDRETVKACVKKAMKLLEYSDRTEKQLRDKLKEGEFPPFAIDQAISYVDSFHYLDDGRYAEIFIRSRSSRKSRFEIRQELKQRGISEDLISEKLDEAEIDEEETVKELFLKKYKRLDLDDPKSYQKVIRYFASKGFSFDCIKSGISDAISEMEEEIEE